MLPTSPATGKSHLQSSRQVSPRTLVWLICVQGLMLLVVGPLIDKVITEQWVLQYAWSPAAAHQLLLSCALAVLVNISQFMCLGRFSAVSFQVSHVPSPTLTAGFRLHAATIDHDAPSVMFLAQSLHIGMYCCMSCH